MPRSAGVLVRGALRLAVDAKQRGVLARQPHHVVGAPEPHAEVAIRDPAVERRRRRPRVGRAGRPRGPPPRSAPESLSPRASATAARLCLPYGGCQAPPQNVRPRPGPPRTSVSTTPGALALARPSGSLVGVARRPARGAGGGRASPKISPSASLPRRGGRLSDSSGSSSESSARLRLKRGDCSGTTLRRSLAGLGDRPGRRRCPGATRPRSRMPRDPLAEAVGSPGAVAGAARPPLPGRGSRRRASPALLRTISELADQLAALLRGGVELRLERHERHSRPRPAAPSSESSCGREPASRFTSDTTRALASCAANRSSAYRTPGRSRTFSPFGSTSRTTPRSSNFRRLQRPSICASCSYSSGLPLRDRGRHGHVPEHRGARLAARVAPPTARDGPAARAAAACAPPRSRPRRAAAALDRERRTGCARPAAPRP